MPEAIGWWPPAVGWWLTAILALSLIVLLVWLHKRLTRKTAAKTAKKLLAEIKRDNTLDNHGKVAELSVLIRRVAISVAPRSRTAGLTGQAWLTYLDSSVKGSPFSEGIGRHLSDAPYRNIQLDDAEIPSLIRLCEDWLKAQARK